MTIFVNKGDLPLTPAQLEKRAQKHIKRVWSDQAREKSIRTSDGAFDAFMSTFSADHDVNTANNTFNRQVEEYLKATSRLKRYELSVGSPEKEVTFTTGEFDPETGEEIIGVNIIPAIEPLPLKIEVWVYDEALDMQVEEWQDNPLVVKDAEERAAANAVLEATPAEVIEFTAGKDISS